MKPAKAMIKVTKAIETACKEPTLLDALSWICLWENDRIVQVIKKNPDKIFDTCFKHCLKLVMTEWR